MTLDTTIAIRLTEQCPLTPREVLDEAILALCGIDGGSEWGPDHLPVIEDRDHWRDPEFRRVGTSVGQGFHAITEVAYRRNGSMLYPQDYTKREYELEFEEERWHEYGPGGELEDRAHLLQQPRCMYELSMDTSYGFRSKSGLSAGGLHMGVGIWMQHWLNGMGGSTLFHDECAGEWFDMASEDGLHAAVESMVKSWGTRGNAVRWFDELVRPAITGMADE